MSRSFVDFGRTPKPDALDRFLASWREMDRIDRRFREMTMPQRMTGIEAPLCKPALRMNVDWTWNGRAHGLPRRDPNEAGRNRGSWLERAARR